ncbi:TniB family NTP-binding protein [Idiomarina sp. ST20R2A10]|uniref:TniB family NTP-binding protein n=1 Tax=Idiomarina sp. ST20R2A10 TaxID=3418369 RepID=UPI003EC86BD2
MYFDIQTLNEEQKARYLEVERLLVFTDKFTEVFNAIKHQHDSAVLKGFESRSKNILIYGPSGAGKSAIVEYYRDRYPEKENVTAAGSITSVPVLYVSLPNDKNPKAAPKAILNKLGDPPRRSNETTAELNAAFKGLAEKTGVEVIIIDELHNAFKEGSKSEMLRAATWIKTIINDTKRLVVLVGLEAECKKLMELDSEVETRFPIRFDVSFYSGENFDDWLALLHSLDNKLPFDKLSGLADREIAVRLLLASQGRISYLMERVIRPAAQLAIYEDTSNITIEQLFEASKDEIGVPYDSNPLNTAAVPTDRLRSRSLMAKVS